MQKPHHTKRTKPIKFQDPQNSDSTTITGQIVAMNEFGNGEIHGNRRTIKVARCVVGDRVSVKVPQSSKSYIYGKLIKIVKPSDKRVDPKCAAFDAGCGGCFWLSFDYTEQLRWKTRILRELLKERCNSSIRVNDIVPMENPYAYRNKMSLRNVSGRFVNMQDFDDSVVSPKICRVETEPNQKARDILMRLSVPRDLLQAHVRSAEDGGIGIHLFVVHKSPAVVEFAKKISQELSSLVGIGASDKNSYEVLFGSNTLKFTHQEIAYTIPLNGFFQTNYSQARYLVDCALHQLNICSTDAVLDLYCGCGFFSLPMAKLAKKVLGIENNDASTKHASVNATANNLHNATFQTADVATALRSLKCKEWDCVLLDPPRSGCDDDVVQELIRICPKKIVYISCSPSSLAKNLKQFLAGSYMVSFCQPIDMFPHTPHMETIVTLIRRLG